MALTKSGSAIDTWAEIAQNAMRIGSEQDVSGNYEHLLMIMAALTSETTHTGIRIFVEVSEETLGDEFWNELTSFVALIGTAASETITNNPLAVGEGDNTNPITVASTTGFETEGTRCFLKDGDTFANSEPVFLQSFVSNTSISLRDNVTRQHSNSSILYNILESFVLRIPMGVSRVRVTYDNTYDNDGSTVATLARIAKVTSVS